MLKALHDQLRELSKTDEVKFAEAIKKRQGGKATDEQISKVKEFIFLMPPALEILSDYWQDKSVPSGVKGIARHIISYIFHPDDFLPEDEAGMFGYLDDAYLTVSAFLLIQESYLRDWQDKSKKELELLERARQLVNIPRVLIPEEAQKIEELLNSWVEEDK
ncbi:MAG: hypothetical protein GF307_13905 [candidate division Zixibacteria bacterium]|nr:hypothetical protein [candidate division Zixibacteria bacterium]